MHTRISVTPWRALVALALLAQFSAQAQNGITLYPMGNTPNAANLSADNNHSEIRDAVQNAGMIVAVGTASQNVMGDTAVAWVSWNSADPLVTLPQDSAPGPGNQFVAARAITPDGAVIGGSAWTTTSSYTPGTYRSAALWTHSAGPLVLTTIGVLGPNQDSPGQPAGYAAVNALSADGSVAYGFSTYGNGGYQQAFRYTASGGMVGLGFLTQNGVTDVQSVPTARGVSADGAVMVGTSYTAANGGVVGPGGLAFKYTVSGSTGTMSALTLATGMTWSYALALTPTAGTIVGWTGSDAAGDNGQLVRWTNGGTQTELLGTPDPTASVNILGGVTADGQVMAVDLLTATTSTTYIRNSNGWFNLVTALSTSGVDLSHWASLDVEGLSADGTLIWGDGTLQNGAIEGWIATLPAGYLAGLTPVPEPAHMALAAGLLGLGAVLGWRRRKQNSRP